MSLLKSANKYSITINSARVKQRIRNWRHYKITTMLMSHSLK